MKILKLKSKNLNSLKGENEIDFTSTQFQKKIFAIVGKTGAGKSTLLDAISLALYAQTFRLKKNVSQLITEGSSDAYAEVMFEVNRQIYRSRFEQRRSQDKIEAQMSLFQGKEVIAKGVDAVSLKIEALLGLDFTQFHYSIVLSQGIFDTFLKAEPRERIKLLERVNNTEVYANISKKSFEKAQKEQETFNRMESILKNLSYLEPSKRQELFERKKVLESEKGQFNFDNIMKSYVEKVAFDKLASELKVEKSGLEKLQSKLLSQQLEEKKYEDFIRFFTLEYRKIDEAKLIDSELSFSYKNLKNIQQEHDQLAKEFALIEQSIIESDDSLAKFRIRETLLKKELNGFIQMQHLQQNHTLILSKFNEREKLQEELKKFKLTAYEKLDEQPLCDKITTLESHVINLDKVIKSQNIEKIQQQSMILENKILKISERERIEKRQLSAEVEKEELSSKLKKETLKKEKISEEKKSLAEIVTQLEEKIVLEQKIINYERDRAELKEHEPCPLCGSLEHPLFSDTIEPNRTSNILNEKRRVYSKIKVEEDSCEKSIQKLKLEAEALEKMLLEDKKVLMSIGEMKGNLQLLKEEQRLFLKQIDTVNRQKDELLLNKNKILKHKEELSQLRIKVEQNKNRRKVEEQLQIKIQELSYFLIKTLRMYNIELDVHSMSMLNTKRKQFETLSSELEELHQKMNPLEGQKMQNISRKMYVEDSLFSLKKRLSIQECDILLSQQKRAATIGEKTVLAYSQALEEKKEKQQKRYNDFLSLKKEFQEKKSRYFKGMEKLEGQQKLKLISLDKLQQEKNRIEEKLALINQELGVINEKLKEDQENLKKRENEKNSLKEQEKIAKKWMKLNEIIGSEDGQKYQIFAQNLMLSSLVELANSYLKKLNHRYLLAMSKKTVLELEVLDLYQGESRRAVQTLSGGESFIVSLALSLALLDLNSEELSINTLFLDEGFETLDEESLKLVLSTLSNLENEERIIGIISHIPMLKEQIRTQIKIEKKEGGVSELVF